MENDTHTQARPARRLPNRGSAGNGGDGAGHSGSRLGGLRGHDVAGHDAVGVTGPLQVRTQLFAAHAGGLFDGRAARGGDAPLTPVGQVLRKHVEGPGQGGLGANRFDGAVDGVHDPIKTRCLTVVNTGFHVEQRPGEWEHKRMVSTLTSYAERLAYIAKACQYPTDAAFAEAVGVKAQNLRNWRERNSIGKDSLGKIKAATGASLDWLTSGVGVPFPDGPILYAGPSPTAPEALGRIADLERDVEHLVAAVRMLVTRLGESSPVAAVAMASDLRGYLSKAGRPSAVLPELQRAADGVIAQAPPAAAGKKPRSSR